MAGMRDRLIHDYIGVNYIIVWDVFKNKIPAFFLQIQEVINKEQKPLPTNLFTYAVTLKHFS